MRVLALSFALALVAAACGGAASGLPITTPSATPSSPPSPTAVASAMAMASATAIVVGTIRPNVTPVPVLTIAPTPTPSPAPGGLAQAQLKYRIVDQVGRPLFCDPDFYPIARADEQALADQRFPEIQKDAPTFSAILAYLRIAPATSYTSDQRLAIYREWKMLNALRLEPVSAGYHFSIRVMTAPQQIFLVDGTIDPFGTIWVASRTSSTQPPCPICLARGTRIATPYGDVVVEDLRVGDAIWTTDERGDRVAAPLVAIGSTPVPATHEVVRLALDDGRVMLVSPGHPTADGRRVGDLVVGDALDGSRVIRTERSRYGGGATFDVLPASASGAYWANGVLLGSTLR